MPVFDVDGPGNPFSGQIRRGLAAAGLRTVEPHTGCTDRDPLLRRAGRSLRGGGDGVGLVDVAACGGGWPQFAGRVEQ